MSWAISSKSCGQPGAAVRAYDAEAVQPAGARVDDTYVRRAVAAALEVDGLRALADGGHEFTVESLALQPLFDEDCLVGPGEAVPEGCEPPAGGFDEMRRLRDRDAHGGNVRLRLAEPAEAPPALVDACPASAGAVVEAFLVQAFVHAAEDHASDVAYMFSVSTAGGTVGCAAERTPPDGPPTDPELEEDSR